MNLKATKSDLYVVSYDISETKIRNKIFKVLKNYGVHKQYSVFECDLPKDRFQSLYRELLELMKDEEEGNIRFYRLCKHCREEISVIGIEEDEDEDKDDDAVVVI